MINTHIQIDLVSSIALEHAVSMVTHPLFESYEVIPKKAIELTFKQHVYDKNDKYMGVETAVFRCNMLKRESAGFKAGLPMSWDEFCFTLQQFSLKSVSHPRGKRSQEINDFWWEVFAVIMIDIKANIPEAIYDTGTKTWWIGDNGFNTEVGLPVKK